MNNQTQIIKAKNAVGNVRASWLYTMQGVDRDIVCLTRCRPNGKEYTFNKTNVVWIRRVDLDAMGFDVVGCV